MMARWVECVLALSQNRETIFINLDNVATMRKHSEGTSITLVGLPENSVLVREEPSEIIAGE